MRYHAFVAMPFGTKPGFDDKPIDFNHIYSDYIKPALETAGFEVFRADQEQHAGDIREDMFQELLVADLVVADLTLDNPNVWYELGVRHALRARGVVLVQGPRPTQPFDIYTERKLRYGLKDGVPDPATVENDKRALAAMAQATITASHARKVSPVFALLDNLEEPDWRTLLLKGRNEFSDAHMSWQRRMETAGKKLRPGDILVLAEETPTYALWLEGKRAAGNCLMKLTQYRFALEQFDDALAVAPNDVVCRQKKAVCLGRLGRYEEGRDWVRALTQDFPADPECWALLGRVEKDDWVSRWRQAGMTPTQMRELAAAEEPALLEAIEPYSRAFIYDPSHFYSGINAAILQHVHRHLGAGPDEKALRHLEGGVLWACLAALKREPKYYWARASLAELMLLTSSKAEILREYKSAITVAERDWFALDSTRQTLTLLRDLEFRLEEVSAALALVDREIARLTPPWQPRQVLLFSGHMVDQADRGAPRFPSEKAPIAAQAIEEILAKLGASAEDLGITQGACGGDLLFAEACSARGVQLKLYQPFEEAEFIERSVAFGGHEWRERYHALKGRLAAPPLAAPQELGPAPASVDPYERCNRWLLYSALAQGIDKLRFVCLWGGGGDGPGGTAHMYAEVKRRTGQVYRLDPRTLW